MLIRLKAATMARPCTDEELRWRYQTWSNQSVKELVRLTQSFGYVARDRDVVQAGNVMENEHDDGWHYPLPEAEVQAQLRDLNERVSRGGEHPQVDFWLDRQDMNEDDRGSETSGWGENDCVCGQDPCECRNIPHD